MATSETARQANEAIAASLRRLIEGRQAELDMLERQRDEADHPWVRAAIIQRMVVVRERLRARRAALAEIEGVAL